jgi:hypothetical protein
MMAILRRLSLGTWSPTDNDELILNACNESWNSESRNDIAFAKSLFSIASATACVYHQHLIKVEEDGQT